MSTFQINNCRMAKKDAKGITIILKKLNWRSHFNKDDNSDHVFNFVRKY